jgi:hypothetical protein
MLGRRVGSKEVLKVMVGESQVWPPEQQVEVVSAVMGVGTMLSFGTHQSGDLLVVLAAGSDNNPPSLATNWTSAFVDDGMTWLGVRIGFRYASGSSTSSGTWRGAAYMAAYAFRGANNPDPFGAIASLYNIAENGTAPGITPVDSTGASAVINSFINNGTATAMLADGPIGWRPRSRNARVAIGQRIDSRVILPSTDALSNGQQCDWRGVTFEIPPASGLQHMGTYTSDGEIGVTIAPHQPGDLIVVVAQMQNTTVALSPSTPPAVAGQTYPVWNNAYDSNTGSGQGVNMACKVAWGWATTSSHDTGSFTGAAFTTTMVFRNANPADPIGAVAGNIFSAIPAGPIASPALSMEDSSGKSLHIVAMVESSMGSNSYFAVNPPDGWTRLIRGGHRLLSSSQDRKSGPVCTEITPGDRLSWRTVAFEVKAVDSISEPPLDPWLLDQTTTYDVGWVSNTSLVDGWPEGDGEEAYFFRCTQLPENNGYVPRNFSKTWRQTAYGALDCTVEDLSNIPGKERKTITFQINPHA